MPAPTPKIIYRPLVFTVTAGSNDKIDFDENGGSGEVTATLTAGEYSGAGLALEVETQMESAGGQTYTAIYTVSTEKITITKDTDTGNNLSLLWNTGTNTATTAGGLMGYSVAADDTGALFYVSDNKAPAAVTLTLGRDIYGPRMNMRSEKNEAFSSIGIRRSLVRHISYQYGFEIKFETRAIYDNWISFMEDNALRGGQFDFYPDSAEATFVNFKLADTEYAAREMVDQNLFQRFAFSMQLREVLPVESIHSPGGRGSRMTTLTNRVQWV